MAENMVAGLFGLTPEMYQNQQYQQDLKRGYELAQLRPGAAAQAGLQASIGQLGRGVAGLMGVEDPMLNRITQQDQLLRGLDLTNPESLLEGAKIDNQMGNRQAAFALTDYARKQASEIAQAQQRLAAGQASLAAASRERFQADPEKVRLAKAVAATRGPEGSPEYITAYNESLEKQMTPTEKDLRFGTDREAISSEVYDKPFAQLTPSERAVVNKRVEDEQGRKAEKGAAKLTFPGQKDFADIPKFRADVQKTIAPQIQSVTAADQALQAINDSIASNNFVSFNAARVQLAKALGDSQLSRRDVEQAGGDPSLFGRMLDSTSTLFTGTPTLETQNLIKNTLSAIKKVSTDKANREITVQRNIAYNTPGYDRARVDAALKFPEFEATTASPISGDVAAQARAILEQRKKGSK